MWLLYMRGVWGSPPGNYEKPTIKKPRILRLLGPPRPGKGGRGVGGGGHRIFSSDLHWSQEWSSWAPKSLKKADPCIHISWQIHFFYQKSATQRWCKPTCFFLKGLPSIGIVILYVNLVPRESARVLTDTWTHIHTETQTGPILYHRPLTWEGTILYLFSSKIPVDNWQWIDSPQC